MATAATARKTADDWLGLRPHTAADELTATPQSYEPSSSSSSLWGAPNATRRPNLRRQSTQQARPSRSAGLLFSDDDDDDGGGGSGGGGGDVDGKMKTGRNAVVDSLAADGNDRGSGRQQLRQPTTATTTAADGDAAADRLSATTSTTLAADQSLSRRRETSPSISAVQTSNRTVTAEMPSWLSGLIQRKDDTSTKPTPSTARPRSPRRVPSVEETTRSAVQNVKNESTEEKPSSSLLTLLKGKDNLQTSILELVQELAKKKQDIQQATITLIQDQQNNDRLVKALLMDSNPSATFSDGQELERLRSENHKLQLTIDHISKKHELELDAIKTRYELQQDVLHEKIDRYEKRINEIEEERKADMIERRENEKRLKEMYEDRLRVMHESHLIDLKQSAEVQKIKMSHLEEVESSLRDSKPKLLTNDEMTAREISISAQDKRLKDLQEEVGKQMAELEGERSALHMKIEEFQSRNQRERNELELDSKELKRSVKAFEESRKTWEREKKSEIQYIENRKQELEAVRSSIVEEQRKLAEERFEVASERYKLESMLKLDAGTGTDLIQARVEVKENFKELKKKEKELEKRLDQVKELEKRLTGERHKLQEQDDEIKMKTIRAEKMLQMAISKQEEGLKALENAKDIQNKFDKKGKDLQNRLLEVIKREDEVAQEETKLAREKDAFYKQRKKLDLVLPQLSADEMRFLNPKPNKIYEPEKEVYYKKTQI